MTQCCRILASGCSLRQAAIGYRYGYSTVGNIFTEICHALYMALQCHVKPPSSPEDWEKLKNEFYEKTQFPNCIGALDGKHIVMCVSLVMLWF